MPTLFTPADLAAIGLTARLAVVSTAALLLVGTPLAWWLARSRSMLRGIVSAVVSLPLVLPPTVLGFYLLLLLGPDGPIGRATRALGLGLLPFTFGGLVVASVAYSMPFVVRPLQASFAALGREPMEAAATLRAGPLDRFLTIALPMAAPGFLAAAVLAFAHTVGEFGIVLMLGGNIPGRTQVLSVILYDHVEALEYDQAHRLAAAMVLFALAVLLAIEWTGRRRRGVSAGPFDG